MSNKFTENIEKVEKKSFKILTAYGLVISFIFLFKFNLLATGLALRNNANGLYTPQLVGLGNLLIVIILPLLINILCSEILLMFEIKNKRFWWILHIENTLIIFSIALFGYFVISELHNFDYILNQWINAGALISTGINYFGAGG